MAKKRAGVSKTDAIRDHITANPDDGPGAVAQALNEKGVKVTPQYVSTIKSKLGLGAKRRRGRPAGSGKKAAAPAGAVGYDNLVQAKKFVHSLGGVDKARKVLEAYASLQ